MLPAPGEGVMPLGAKSVKEVDIVEQYIGPGLRGGHQVWTQQGRCITVEARDSQPFTTAVPWKELPPYERMHNGEHERQQAKA